METTGGSYVVSIPVYEGPMDLLLHLVSKNRIEIHDIPIHEITDQYLDYLNPNHVQNQLQCFLFLYKDIYHKNSLLKVLTQN